jgi:meso-butanediol dehydrogenase/(S,S)-butanediol dehydrogenase/diacetyl reductase
MERFGGKVALVSGAASGIGKAVVQRLADEGAKVVGADVAEVEGGVVCDVRDPDACAAVVAATLERHGQLDVLVNVAGVGGSWITKDMPNEDWRRIIDINLTGTFQLTQAALPALLESKGAIVNLASVSGIRATPYNAAYCASKGGVVMFTKSLGIELAKTGVRVNAVCPSGVDTPLIVKFAKPEEGDETLLARLTNPMGRLLEPAEVAAAVAYLASPDASGITGTTLAIDGAATA